MTMTSHRGSSGRWAPSCGRGVRTDHSAHHANRSRKADASRSAAPPSRVLIESFAMQHPKRACKSAKSYAAHFTGLCCVVEYGGSQHAYAALQRVVGVPG